MVVDDEEFCIAAMQAMLEKAGIDINHQVDFCSDGQEAIDTLLKSYEKGICYKIIFTDFSMPVMDGIDATKKIRSILKDKKHEGLTTIVGITGHVQGEFQEEGIKAGMDQILAKPLYAGDLKKTLIKYGLIDLDQ